MVIKTLFIAIAATTWVVSATTALAQGVRPTVVLAGGNGMGPEITKPILEMAGGSRAVVVVVVHAKGPGDESVETWKGAGATEVLAVNVSQLDDARATLDRATLIWFAGGSTTTLMNAIGGYVPSRGRVELLGDDVSHMQAAVR